MTIKILPPQLANQIAAGEVVERPASVVKELVENALDAGASKIDIEIDKGGHKRILIRDNGKGIEKEQLALALSRHATSKISDIDDLEAIVSLGFRGEALASISSVARLTMTSKPKAQQAAWSAMAEGLDMAVKVQPAAHPDGTTVEVLDLFFNTPARRKFLRAEKTEFSHIEALIKRIALSRPDVSFALKHNSKVVKRYRSQQHVIDELEQTSNRIAEVINPAFVELSNVVKSQYENIHIAVWIKSPASCVMANPAQYTFVNGRMMRDKLIQHAIRQAYGKELGPEQLPEYVVFIDLPAEDVDVNVHPAKHEVRFHHARLLHDFLVKIIEEALANFHNQENFVDQEPEWLVKSSEPVTSNYQQAAEATEITKSQLWSETPTQSKADMQGEPIKPAHFSGLKPKSATQRELNTHSLAKLADSVSHLQKADVEPETNHLLNSQTTSSSHSSVKLPNSQINVCFVDAERFIYFSWQQGLWLVDGEQLIEQTMVDFQDGHFAPAPLLVPTRIKLSPEEKSWCNTYGALLEQIGFEILLHQDFLIIKQVPILLRSSGSGQALPNVFSKFVENANPTLNGLKQTLANSKVEQASMKAKIDKLHKLVEENALHLETISCKLNAESLLLNKNI
jgi:DNA mismatch repair protein MutL